MPDILTAFRQVGGQYFSHCRSCGLAPLCEGEFGSATGQRFDRPHISHPYRNNKMPPTTRDVPEAFRTAGAKLSAPLVTVWRRGRVKVNDLLGNPTPETPVGHESTRPPTPKTHTPTPGIHPPTPEIYTPTPEIHTPTPETHTPTPEISMLAPSILPTLPTPTPSPQRTWIPYEVMEMIICCLAYDFYALKQCSLTCRPFYTAATPHLHHTLTLREDTPESGRSWLEPLSKLHELDLVRLVRGIRVEQGSSSSSWFVPGAFSDLDSRYFSAFKRVHTLKIQSFQLYRFVPGFEHLFEHFSPTLRSITLYDLCCTPRQLSYFLCLFPNLDDVDIEKTVAPPATTAPVTELIPSSAPKLQGCLVLYEFSWVETWTDLITSRGELGFRHMDLFQSKKCAPVLLGACAETLESIRIHVRDDTVSEWPHVH